MTPLWGHQQAALSFVEERWNRGLRGVLLAIIMGGGKSRVAIELALRNRLSPILILAPLRVVEVWRTQFGLYAPDYDFLALDARVSSVRKKAIAARDRLAWATARKRPLAIAINWQSARLEPFAQWALANMWPLVIGDECVPPGSLISTPRGEIAIEQLRPGDLVWGVDHATGRIVETTVRQVMHRETISPFVEVGNTKLTPEHPVWTFNRGYIPARLIRPSDEVWIYVTQSPDACQNLRVLPGVIPRPQRDHKVLQSELPGQSNFKDSRIPPAQREADAASNGQTRSPGQGPAAFSFHQQPFPPTRDQAKSESQISGHGVSVAEWRQRTRPHRGSVFIGGTAGMADGVDLPDPRRQEFGVSDPLQNRYRGAALTNCDRGRRAISSQCQDPAERPEEGRLFGSCGLDGIALLEYGDYGESRSGGASHPVYNLETGTGNYFANGLLVHNCHKIKEPTGATSRFAGRLALRAHRRLGLTGTPMPHSPLDVWAQFRFLDRNLYDPTFTAFRLRYAVTNPHFHNQVESWRNLDDLRKKFFSLSFQVGEEVLDLPEAHEQTLYCTLSPKGREAYEAMEAEFVAWVETDRMVTASNALVRLMRLQQITSGVVKDTAGTDCVVDTSKRQLLEDLLEDLPADEPVVVFAHFKSDLAAVHEVAAALGRASGEVSGDQTRRGDLAAWQRGRAGDPVILAVQLQAGEAGIDLTRSRYGIYFSLDYNLGHYLQSRKRLHRHGQKWPVMFYHLMAADTIDQRVAGALERRQQLVESVLQEYQCHQTTTAS